MKPVDIHPEAQSELLESARFYQARLPGFGRRFAAAVRKAIRGVRENPLRYPVIENDIRQCRVLRFPYALV